MSYDLVVFESGAAPEDRAEFLAWYTEAARLGDCILSSDPATTSPHLRAWYRNMIEQFPPIDGPDAVWIGDRDNQCVADYRFTPVAVFVAFQWEASRHAHRQAIKLARNHRVGFFDASGEDTAVWGMSSKGAYTILHRNTAKPADDDDRRQKIMIP
ncbi:MAG: hypothetical protein GC155_17475 [Alphaproteobacteria bacterium]|nr:hypothetical protein [Alphaproteobacteria bacterium]